MEKVVTANLTLAKGYIRFDRQEQKQGNLQMKKEFEQADVEIKESINE